MGFFEAVVDIHTVCTRRVGIVVFILQIECKGHTRV